MTPSTDLLAPTGVHDYRPGGGTVAPPTEATVVAALLRTARQTPSRSYLTWCPADGATRILTYGELERRSRRLAAFLVTTLRPGSTVALLPGNDIPSVIAVFGALRAGMPCLFLNPADPVARLRTLLDAHPVAAVLCSPYAPPHARDFARGTAGDRAGLILGDDEPVSADNSEAPDILPGDGPVPAERPAFLFGTSGSTAASKLVVQPHRAVTSNAEAVRRQHRLDDRTVLMGGLPLHHVNGVHFTLMAPAATGAHVVLPQEFSLFTYRSFLDAHRPHLASLVPPVLEMLLASGRDWRPPKNLRYFVSAAAPLSRSLLRRTVETFGVRVLQGYGLSETTNFSTTVPSDISDETYRAVALDAEIPSVGVALHGNEIEVFAPDGTVLGERCTGELRMRGHNVMAGYAGRPDLTAEAFTGGWFHSGDIGYWATGSDGRRYFYLTGRDKNMAKVRGESVSLEEVERALVSLDGVTDAACLAVPHSAWGEQLVAVVAAPEADLPGIRTALAGLVPTVAVPGRWHSVERVPRSATGKLLRPVLVERYAAEAER
ncbi:class I adenylate-forming enzyme family protein [Streptomyces sp. NPDC002763]|uniref:class I adenylate-forming enzyme family protein n=1 Tax=Streptomyces sp. NPDC002763 TaxID=3154427 RepID=UPI003330E629